MTEIERFADKPEEQVLARGITDRISRLTARNGKAPRHRPSLARMIRERVMPVAESLRRYNGKELQQSEEGHRRSLQRMTWGLVIVAGLGSIAGLVFGYGLARGLRHTIHQFLLRVQGATELLGQELPVVELQRSTIPRERTTCYGEWRTWCSSSNRKSGKSGGPNGSRPSANWPPVWPTKSAIL